MGFRVSAPAQNTGYNRTTDWPSGGGTPGGGKAMAAKGGFFSQTIGTGTGQWHPTILWMMGFVVVELIAFHMLSKFLNL
jgi:hypothetical protein